MIFGIVVILLVGAIAYFHYVQGFFSATISAILAIVSAVIALSYNEVIIRSLLKGKIADQANALMLVVLFVACYGILRVIFDSAIPGNVRLPVMLDRVGGGVMGIVAGVFGIGIFAIAAQSLPFGPSIAGYSRYDLIDREEKSVSTGGRRAEDASAYNVLKPDSLGSEFRSGLILPVDDIVVNTTAHLSAGGSLAGNVNFSDVHPDLLVELFGQRLGIQTGAKRVAYNIESEKQVELRGLHALDVVTRAPGELEAIRKPSKEETGTLKSDAQDLVLVVSLSFSRNATDSDNNVRVSTGAVRLVAKGADYFPVGTLDLEAGPVLRVNKPDDFIIVPGDGVAHFVFYVPREALGVGDAKSGPLTIGPKVFVEAKRLADVDLSGQEIKSGPPQAEGAPAIIRKADLPKPAPTPGMAAAVPIATDAPIVVDKIQPTDAIFTDINVGTHDGDNASVTFASGTATLRGGKFAKLEVNTTQTITLLSQGDYPIRNLAAPGGQKVVLVSGTPAKGKNWDWADKLSSFELVASDGKNYKSHGAIAKVKQGTSDRMVAKYDADAEVRDLSEVPDARPTDLWIAFVIPEGANPTELRFEGKRVGK